MIVAACWGGSLHAQTQQQVDACEGKGNPPLDTVITSCTALIGSGSYAGRDLSTVYVIRATAYQRKGELGHAIQDYDRAIGLDPSGATAYYNRGVAYGRKADWDRAIQDYDQAIRHHPNDAAAFRNRGVAYQEKKQFDRAIQDFDGRRCGARIEGLAASLRMRRRDTTLNFPRKDRTCRISNRNAFGKSLPYSGKARYGSNGRIPCIGSTSWGKRSIAMGSRTGPASRGPSTPR
jgi:hypothetical protein